MSPLAAVRREYRSLPPVFWALWLGTFVNKAGGFVVPFLSLYVGRTLGFGEAAAGGTVAAYGAGNAVAGVIGGVLADRVGRRFTILVSLFGGAITMAGLAFAKSVWALALASFLMGLLAEMYRPAQSAMVADIVPLKDRARAFAYLYWVVNLGFAVAPPLAALALASSYITLFAVDGLTLAVFGVVVFMFVPESRPEVGRTSSTEGVALRALARDRVFLFFVVLAGITGAIMWQNGSALPLDMTSKGISELTYGSLMSINGVLIVALQPFITRAISGRSRTSVVGVATIVFGVGFGLYAVVSTPLGYGVAIAVWTLGEIALMPMLATVAADLSPPAYRGRYQGAYSTSWGAAAALGPLAGGFLLAGPGSRTLWISCFVVLVLVAAAHFASGRARERRAAELAGANDI